LKEIPPITADNTIVNMNEKKREGFDINKENVFLTLFLKNK
jgi:hypothetical protein